MMKDSGVATVPAGIERFEIAHNLGRAPNIVAVLWDAVEDTYVRPERG